MEKTEGAAKLLPRAEGSAHLLEQEVRVPWQEGLPRAGTLRLAKHGRWTGLLAPFPSPNYLIRVATWATDSGTDTANSNREQTYRGWGAPSPVPSEKQPPRQG